jgi:hypothetical protein
MKNLDMLVFVTFVFVTFNGVCFILPKSVEKYVVWLVANVAMGFCLKWLWDHRKV